MFDQDVLTLLHRLIDNGYKAYLVGGVVRDSIIGIESHDYDVTTDCVPEKVKEIFSDQHIYSYGEKFGTIVVDLYDNVIEITTFRKNEQYSDNRHPESLEFGTSLEEDVTRRDFTINAIAYDLETNKIIDLTNGIDDINNKLIRAIGDPKERFREDALRILRAIRFSSTLSYDIEEDTKKALESELKYLDNISKERITQELFKMLENNFYDVYNNYFFCFKYLIPVLNKSNIELFKYDIPRGAVKEIRLYFLCLNSSDPEYVLNYFRCENKIKKAVRTLFKYQSRSTSGDVNSARLLAHEIGFQNLVALNLLHKILGEDYYSDDCINEASLLLFDYSILNISGDDIKEYFNINDRRIKDYLEMAFNAVLDKWVENDKEKILQYIEEHRRD